MYFSQSLGGLLLYCFLGLRSCSPNFIWAHIVTSYCIFQSVVIFPYRLCSYRLAGLCSRCVSPFYVHFPLRLIWAHLERSFPQGFCISFAATDFISDLHSSHISWVNVFHFFYCLLKFRCCCSSSFWAKIFLRKKYFHSYRQSLRKGQIAFSSHPLFRGDITGKIPLSPSLT